MIDEVEALQEKIRDDNMRAQQIEIKLKELEKTEVRSIGFHPTWGLAQGEEKRAVMVGSIFSIHVITAQAINGGELPASNYAVRCSLGGQAYSTSASFGSQPDWNEILTFDVTNVNNKFTIELENVLDGRIIGKRTEELSIVSQRKTEIDQMTQEFKFKLDSPTGVGSTNFELRVKLHWIYSKKWLLKDLLW